jgi:hypothetical protein
VDGRPAGHHDFDHDTPTNPDTLTLDNPTLVNALFLLPLHSSGKNLKENKIPTALVLMVKSSYAV